MLFRSKYKVEGYVNDQNMVERVRTWIDNDVMGDMLVEGVYTDWKDFGGVKVPTFATVKQGGFPTLILGVTDAKANAPVTIPAAQQAAAPAAVTVDTEKIADGVYYLKGGSHHSVFRNAGHHFHTQFMQLGQLGVGGFVLKFQQEVFAFTRLLKLLAGIDLVHVPYKGTALVYPDMFSGQIQLLFDLPSVALPFIKAGRVKALAVSGKHRAAVLPDLPTIAESGVPGYEADLWFGMWGPGGLPRAAAARIQGDLARLMQAPDVKERFTSLGMDAVGSTPEAFAAFVAAEFAKWEKVVRASGARAD